MNELRPRLTPPSRSKELMMPADRVILQYRDKLDEFEARGWRLDMEGRVKATQARGDVTTRFPARRAARRMPGCWMKPRACPCRRSRSLRRCRSRADTSRARRGEAVKLKRE
jgi:hypothetical protein